MFTYDDRYMRMVDDIVANTSHDCPSDRADTSATHNDHISSFSVSSFDDSFTRVTV